MFLVIVGQRGGGGLGSGRERRCWEGREKEKCRQRETDTDRDTHTETEKCRRRDGQIKKLRKTDSSCKRLGGEINRREIRKDFP